MLAALLKPLTLLFVLSAALLPACGNRAASPDAGEDDHGDTSQPPALEDGHACGSEARCAPGLACVADVGAEYGLAADADVCERPRAIYSFVHLGERGESRRIDEALDMMAGVFRVARNDTNIVVEPYALMTADGTRVRCHGVLDGSDRDCLVPDWQLYVDNRLGDYSSFIFYGLRFAGVLHFTQRHASDELLRQRIAARLGRPISDRELADVRREAGQVALAVFDSFVQRGHATFALSTKPACGDAYQNPNVQWAPLLDQWDPALRLTGGRLVATTTRVGCTGALGYTELRNSLWDKHGTSYRALALVDAYYLFRGVLSPESRQAWLRVLRETGDALALPSGFEPGNNHGLTQSAALLQLSVELDAPELVSPELAAAWRKLALHRLNDLIGDTVSPDGVQVEQSPFYHNYQLILMIQISDWLERNQLDLSAGVDARYHAAADTIPTSQRLDYDASAPAPQDPDLNDLNPSTAMQLGALLTRMVSAAVRIAQPDGWIPVIGSSPKQFFRGYQPAVLDAYAEGESDAAHELLFYRSAGASGAAPVDRLAVFADSGFVTMHSGFGPELASQTHLVLNAGMPYHGHSHADALSLHLFGPDPASAARSGMPLLVDAGWYSYVDPGRHYFESTAAHNTVTVDGANQCVREARNMRAQPYQPGRLLSCEELRVASPRASGTPGDPAGAVMRGLSRSAPGWLYQSVRHGLYRGVTHRRAVAMIGSEIVVVIDVLVADRSAAFAQTWHVSPRVPPLAAMPEPEQGVLHVAFARASNDPTPLFSLHQPITDASTQVRLHRGAGPINGVPGQGWHSTTENHSVANQVVEVAVESSSAVFGSVFLLGSLAGQRPTVELLVAPDRDEHRVVVHLSDRVLTLVVENLAAGAPVERVSVN